MASYIPPQKALKYDAFGGAQQGRERQAQYEVPEVLLIKTSPLPPKRTESRMREIQGLVFAIRWCCHEHLQRADLSCHEVKVFSQQTFCLQDLLLQRSYLPMHFFPLALPDCRIRILLACMFRAQSSILGSIFGSSLLRCLF